MVAHFELEGIPLISRVCCPFSTLVFYCLLPFRVLFTSSSPPSREKKGYRLTAGVDGFYFGPSCYALRGSVLQQLLCKTSTRDRSPRAPHWSLDCNHSLHLLRPELARSEQSDSVGLLHNTSTHDRSPRVPRWRLACNHTPYLVHGSGSKPEM